MQTCGPLKNMMDDSNLIMKICVGKSIGVQRVNKLELITETVRYFFAAQQR